MNLDAYLGDGSAEHYFTPALSLLPQYFKNGAVINITNAIEAASVAWKSYEDAEEGDKFNFECLRFSASGSEAVKNALEAFLGHQLAQHQQRHTSFKKAMQDIKEQWLKFAHDV